MGYKPGEGIGATGKGRTAPLEIDLRAGRTGLGIHEERKRRKEAAELQKAQLGRCLSVEWVLHARILIVLFFMEGCGALIAQMSSGREAMSDYSPVTLPSKQRPLPTAKSSGAWWKRGRYHAPDPCSILDATPRTLHLSPGQRACASLSTVWLRICPSFCVQVCETLDRRKGITENVMWLPEPASRDAEGQEEDDNEPAEGSWESLPAAQKLEDVLDCLRSRHLYCLFCGCQARPPPLPAL
jgi:hypothetical protein